MTTQQAKTLKRGDKIKVTKDDATFIAQVEDVGDKWLSFIEKLNDENDQFVPKRVGLVELK